MFDWPNEDVEKANGSSVGDQPDMPQNSFSSHQSGLPSLRKRLANIPTRSIEFNKANESNEDDETVDNDDYSDRTNIFNHIAAESSFCELRINSVQYILESMRESNKFLAILPPTEPANSLKNDCKVLEEHMQFLVSQLASQLLRAQFLQKTAQVQISAVS